MYAALNIRPDKGITDGSLLYKYLIRTCLDAVLTSNVVFYQDFVCLCVAFTGAISFPPRQTTNHHK